MPKVNVHYKCYSRHTYHVEFIGVKVVNNSNVVAECERCRARELSCAGQQIPPNTVIISISSVTSSEQNHRIESTGLPFED